jgi:single-stranded DNA-binding protein
MKPPSITIHGTVGNIEVKQSTTGKQAWATGSLAVKVTKSKANWVNPNKVDFKADIDTEWHNFKAWGPIISQIAKGDHIVIFGDQRIESWDKDGKRQYRPMINADEIFITDKVRSWARGAAGPSPATDSGPEPSDDQDPPF